jgi:hypothetical protein
MSSAQLVTLVLHLSAALLAGQAAADSAAYSVDAVSPAGQLVSFEVAIEFTATGGGFGEGTGAAVAAFTLENTSGLVPFQSPPAGNPALTGFFFNVPPGTGVSLREARILAGATLHSTGAVVGSERILPGCQFLAADRIVTHWYELDDAQAAGQHGIFTTSFETLTGVRASLVDPAVFADCVPQGDVYPPLVVAGRLRYEVALVNLDYSLDSAADFLNFCSTTPGSWQPSALGGKFQSMDAYGAGSVFMGIPCQVVPAQSSTWGTLKSLYR